MGTRIEDVSIFGEYKQAENRATAAFLQILKAGGESLIRDISQLLGFQLPQSEIRISTQTREREARSVPDGLLRSDFAFTLWLESKIKKNAVGELQLEEHRKLLRQGANTYLVYLTPDDARPRNLPREVSWANWTRVLECLNSYLKNPKIENRQLLEFLVQHFETFLTNMRLVGTGWDLDNDQVMVVAGAWAEDIALRFSIYICQNRRQFRPSRYISFYFNNRMQYVFEILAPPQDECDLRLVPEFSSHVDEMGLDEGQRRVFRLGTPIEVGPILNDSIDRNGNPCPFTYGQPRYTTIQAVRAAKRTSDL